MSRHAGPGTPKAANLKRLSLSRELQGVMIQFDMAAQYPLQPFLPRSTLRVNDQGELGDPG